MESQFITVQDASEETFELFAATQQDGADLGMLSPTIATLDLTIGPYDFTIEQSPGLLTSNNAQGTTGAALWQSGARLASWIVQVDFPLRRLGLLGPGHAVLELGSGITGIVSSILATTVTADGRVIATDMPYAMRGLRNNLAAHAKLIRNNSKTMTIAAVETAELNWEADDATSLLRALGLSEGLDLVIACDCVYNYALIQPFLDTCATICQMRFSDTPQSATSCLVVQQLRQADVLEEWLDYALTLFSVQRLPASIVGQDLCEESGFVVYILKLR